MTGQIEKVKELKYILLVYSDGTTLKLPESKNLKVGTAFMKLIAKENIDWEVWKQKATLLDRVKDFFNL